MRRAGNANVTRIYIHINMYDTLSTDKTMLYCDADLVRSTVGCFVFKGGRVVYVPF